jgi:23S rRNA (cytosine1962-C5)-methyltransferase
MSRGELILKPGKERSLVRRHPWVYATAVARVAGKPARGDTVAVRSASGAWLAWAAYAPESPLRARCWSFVESERIDAGWLSLRVQRALAARADLAATTDALRLVFGEADALPGLVADRYGSQLVVQFQAPGVDAHRATLIDALVDASGCTAVYDRSDAAQRAREGLAPTHGVLQGEAPPEVLAIVEHGIAYGVDVRRGHKTGFYIDQRDNRRLARARAARLTARLGRPVRALNCFCYTGGFSLALAAGGAGQVVSIDSSAEALRIAADNVRRNAGQPAGGGTHAWREDDVFAALRELKAEGATFDVIVLDPPKFATSQHHAERAARAYKDINLNALRLLAPGGELLTFSCSGAIDADLFQKIVAGAVIDARVDCLMLARLGAGADHAMRMTHPEGEYLKGLLLRRTD